MQVANNRICGSDVTRAALKGLVGGPVIIACLNLIANTRFEVFQEGVCTDLYNVPCTVNHTTTGREICYRAFSPIGFNSNNVGAYLAGALSAYIFAKLCYSIHISNYRLVALQRERANEPREIELSAPPQPVLQTPVVNDFPQIIAPPGGILTVAAEPIQVVEAQPVDILNQPLLSEVIPQQVVVVAQPVVAEPLVDVPQNEPSVTVRSVCLAASPCLKNYALIIGSGLTAYMINILPYVNISKNSLCKEACALSLNATACEKWPSLECPENCLQNRYIEILFDNPKYFAASTALLCALLVYRKIRSRTILNNESNA